MKRWLVLCTVVWLAACGKPDGGSAGSSSPASAPSSSSTGAAPAQGGAIGRAQSNLQKAGEDSAKRRAQADAPDTPDK